MVLLKRKYWLLAGLLALLSCEKKLDITLPYEGDRLVLYCFLNPDEPVTARVYKTGPPSGTLRTEDFYVSNATVRLYRGDTLLQVLTYTGESVYAASSDLRVTMGDDYWLEVEAPGFEPIRSEEVTVHPKPRLIDSWYETDPNRIYLSIRVHTNEAPVIQVGLVGFAGGKEVDNLNEMLADDVSTLTENCVSGSGRGYLFLGECIGDETIVEYDLSRKFRESHDQEQLPIDRLRISIQSTTQAFFDHQFYYPIWGSDLIFFEPNAPVTNIIGGYGIVTSEHGDWAEIWVED